ncbi:unnamed protein product [Diamesa serratosioi]
MNSLIQVLVIFCILQVVCCQNPGQLDGNDKVHDTKLEYFDFLEKNELLQFIEKCDKKETINILTGFIEQELMIRFNCIDTSVNSVTKESILKLKSFFSNCIDPNYVAVVNKLPELSLKFMKKMQCEINNEESKMSPQNIDRKDLIHCATTNVLQIVSCVFSEPEMMHITKNDIEAVNFTIELLDGNDKQCGVVNRIEMCVLRSMKTCGITTLQAHIDHHFNMAMKLFDCKIDKTSKIAESTTVPLKALDFGSFFLNSTKNCDLKALDEIGSKFIIESKPEQNNMKFEQFVAEFNVVCENNKKDEFKSIISKTVELLIKCLDPNYVKHVEKLEIVLLRLVDNLCKLKNQLSSSLEKITKEPEISYQKCLVQNAFPLTGCLFSQIEVRDMINDRSLISNFTLELLDGRDKKCRTLNEITMCFVETLKTCDNKELSMSIKLISDAVLESLDCKKGGKSKGFKSFANNSLILLNSIICFVYLFY